MQTLKQHITHTESGARRFPLYEKYINWTPYQYAMNNPVNKGDIDCKDEFDFISAQFNSVNDGGGQAFSQSYQTGVNYSLAITGTVASMGLSVGGMIGGGGYAINGTMLANSLYSTIGTTGQMVSELTGNSNFASAIPSNLGGVALCGIDYMTGNENHSFQKAGEFGFSAISLSSTSISKVSGIFSMGSDMITMGISAASIGKSMSSSVGKTTSTGSGVPLLSANNQVPSKDGNSIANRYYQSYSTESKKPNSSYLFAKGQ